MSTSADARSSVDGLTPDALAERLGVPRVELYRSIPSTLDVAHLLGAQGAPSGTVIVADEQTAGRGRLGRRWASAPGAGLWLTVIERPTDLTALDVLAVRVGLYAAETLDRLAGQPVGVKWPNDLHAGGRKLGGILIEIRWRGQSPDWAAIGLGINVAAPELETGIGLAPGATRLEALERVVPAIRRAAAMPGHLSPDELSRWTTRDVARGREISEPGSGIVTGISELGELQVAHDGQISAHRSCTVTFV